jgi:hypothetical protein
MVIIEFFLLTHRLKLVKTACSILLFIKAVRRFEFVLFAHEAFKITEQKIRPGGNFSPQRGGILDKFLESTRSLLRSHL